MTTPETQSYKDCLNDFRPGALRVFHAPIILIIRDQGDGR